MPSVNRAAVVLHGKPESLGDARARFERAAAAAGVEIVGDGEADLVVVLGGDGTMLRALRTSLDTSVPVLGVNFGRVGFLTALDAAELEPGLERVFAGDYRVIDLPTLDAATDAARVTGVNDVVATSAVRGRMIGLEWSVGDEPLGALNADGVIAATPSGSTAYNLSNGGPVLVWGLDAMAVTFIAPHSLHARPLVVPRGADLVVRNRTPDVAVTLLVDGHEVGELATGDTVTIGLGEKRSRLATVPESTFFTRYRDTFAS